MRRYIQATFFILFAFLATAEAETLTGTLILGVLTIASLSIFGLASRKQETL